MATLTRRAPVFITTALVFSFITHHAISNYRAYLAVGPGGLPHNIYGWFLSLVLKLLFSKEKLSTKQYDRDPNKQSFLGQGEIKERRGDRPKMNWHVAPSRQLNKFAPPQIHERLIALFDALAAVNSDLVSVVPSRLERIYPAMVINESLATPHTPAEKARREICHIHRGKDFSLHVTMSPQDCKTVIEKGWGERHPLSGSRAVPKEYILLYAPRDDEELAMIARCMRAAICYMANTDEAKSCNV